MTLGKHIGSHSRQMPDDSQDVLYKPRLLKVADRWRDYYNPLTRLRVTDIAAWLFQYQQGIVSNIQWLYRYVERRDPTICALIARRTSAIKKLNWDIKMISEKELPEGYTMADAEAQKQALQENYDRIDNIPEAIEFLALAQFRAYSHLEKHFNAEGDIVHLEPVPQWNWARAGLLGFWAYNPRALQVFYSPDNYPGTNPDLVEIDEKNFVIREVDHPILEAIVLNWIRKAMNLKDWDAYIETYGLPSVFIEIPESAPMVGNAIDPAYLETAMRVASDGRGVLPPGCKIVSVSGNSTGSANNTFTDHIRYIDEQFVLAGTGGLLTMLAKSGSGTLAGAAHKDTFDELAEAEAVEISSVFNSQIDKPILDDQFPDEPQLAWFQLEAQESTDTSKVVADVLNLKSAGLVVDIDQVMEKTGYSLTEVPDPVLGEDGQPPKLAKAAPEITNRYWLPSGPWGTISNRVRRNSGVLAINAMKELAPAQAKQFEKMLAMFRDEVLVGDDANLTNRWHAFERKLPMLLQEMQLKPITAAKFKTAFSTGYLAGVFAKNQ